MKRARGRPRKFNGVKDGATFDVALEKMLPALLELQTLRAALGELPKERGRNRYEEATRAIAAKHGISTATLARRLAQLNWIVGPAMKAIAEDGAHTVVFNVEPTPWDAPVDLIYRPKDGLRRVRPVKKFR